MIARTSTTRWVLTVVVVVLCCGIAQASWEPLGVPSDFGGHLQVNMVFIDGSASMREGASLSPRARAAARLAIAEADEGSYVIVATFGATADVVADRFMLTAHDRGVLYEAIEGVGMNAAKTDIRALEGLVRHVYAQIAEIRGSESVGMTIRVLSDGKPDPVDAAADTQSFEALLGQVTSRDSLGDGLYMYTLVPRPSSLLPPRGASAVSETNGTSQSDRVAASAVSESSLRERVGGGTAHRGGLGNLWKGIAGVVLAGVVTAICVVLARARAQAAAAACRIPGDADVITTAYSGIHPAGFRITEWSVEDGRLGNIESTSTVPYSPGVPFTLGGDRNRATVPLNGDSAPSLLLTVVADGRGGMKLESAEGVNGLSIDERASESCVDLSALERHTIRTDGLEIRLEPAHSLVSREDVLFNIRESDAETDDELGAGRGGSARPGGADIGLGRSPGNGRS